MLTIIIMIIIEGGRGGAENKAGFLGPISSKVTVTKEKERRKRKSEEEERRGREKSNGCTPGFYNGYFGYQRGSFRGRELHMSFLNHKRLLLKLRPRVARKGQQLYIHHNAKEQYSCFSWTNLILKDQVSSVLNFFAFNVSIPLR